MLLVSTELLLSLAKYYGELGAYLNPLWIITKVASGY